MSIKYIIQKKANPLDRNSFKYYPAFKSSGRVTRKELVEGMVSRASLTKQEAETAIDYLFEVLPDYLRKGNTVQLGELGYFRLTFNSEGSDTAEEVSANNVKKVKLKFICGRELREAIKHFSIEKYPVVNHAE